MEAIILFYDIWNFMIPNACKNDDVEKFMAL